MDQKNYYSVISLGEKISPAVFLKNSPLSDINPLQDEPIPEGTYLVRFTSQPTQLFSHHIAQGFGKVLWAVPENSLCPEHIEEAETFEHSHEFKVWLFNLLMKGN